MGEFDGSTVPYKPLFLDGWSPGYIVFDEPDEQKKIIRKPSQRKPNPKVASDTESDYGSDGSVYNVGKQTYKPDKNTVRGGGQEDWRDLLMKSGAEIALVPYTILKTLIYKEAEDYWRDAQRQKSIRPRSPSPYKEISTERRVRSPSPVKRQARSPSPVLRRPRSPSPAPSLPPPPLPQPIISE